MTNLENYMKLTDRVQITIPSTIDIDTPIDTTNMVEHTAELLTSLFGGATCDRATGFWFSDERDTMIKEDVSKVYAYCTQTELSENIRTIMDHCKRLKTELRQEAIALEINGEMYFI